MRGAWKAIKRFSFRLIRKILALIAIIILTILIAVFSVFSFVFRFLGIPGAIIGVGAAGYFYFSSGFNLYQIWLLGAAVISLVFYFVLPLVPSKLESMKDTMEYYYAERLIIRSPVKYTMDIP